MLCPQGGKHRVCYRLPCSLASQINFHGVESLQSGEMEAEFNATNQGHSASNLWWQRRSVFLVETAWSDSLRRCRQGGKANPEKLFHLNKEVCGSILKPTYRMMLDGSIVASSNNLTVADVFKG